MNSGSKSFRVGLVGAGHISPFHIQALRRVPNVQTLGVFDSDFARAKEMVRAFHLPWAFDSYESLLGEVDVVHVLTPPESHAELTVRALEQGCHVFVEKPLATSVADCDRILEAARAAGRTVGVDHSLLKDPFTQRALDLIRRGKIGRVHSVECHRSQDMPPYSGGPLPTMYREGGFPFRDLGIHAFYQVEAFLGEILDVQWWMGHQGSDPNLSFDEWRAWLRCRQGTANVYLSWNVRPVQDLLLVYGSEGVLKLDRFGMTVTVKRKRRLPEHPQRALNALGESLAVAWQVPLGVARVATHRLRRYHGLQQMVHEFYERLTRDEPPPATAEDARRVGYWVEQVAQDADRRRREFRAQFAGHRTAPTLVTGASGFIGRHLLRRLLESGRRVRVLCRQPPSLALRDDPQVEIVLGDLGDPEAVDRAVAGVSTVYHVGGVVHGAAHEFWRGSVEGTRNVVECSLRHKVNQLVYVSSLSVLSALHQAPQPIDEAWPLEAHADRRGLYTQTKLAAEQIVQQAIREQRLPAVIVRPAEVIGPGAPLLSSGVGQRKGSWLIFFGNGQLHVPLIHVEDLVDAMVLCEQHCITDGSVFHLVDDQAVTQNELADKYQAMTGDRLRRVHVPRIAIYALGFAVQSAFALLRRPAPLSVYRLRSALAPRTFDCTRAQKSLQWKPCRGVDRGLRDAVAAATDQNGPLWNARHLPEVIPGDLEMLNR